MKIKNAEWLLCTQFGEEPRVEASFLSEPRFIGLPAYGCSVAPLGVKDLQDFSKIYPFNKGVFYE
jgi:hypothetical protein